MAAPLIRKKRVMAAKAETTPGTAIALGASDGVFNVFDLVIQPDIPTEQRDAQSSLSQLAPVPGGRSGTATFTTELFGSASADPAWMSTLLVGCGFVGSGGAYTPSGLHPEAAGAATKCLTIGAYIDGIFKSIAGAMGNVVFRGTAGGRMLAFWTFRGVWIAPTDVALIAPTYPTTAPLTLKSSGLQFAGSVSPICAEVEIDLGNEVVLRESVNTASGYHTAAIVNRVPRVNVLVEEQLVANWDIHGKKLAMTEEAFDLTLGSAGNQVDFDADKFQYLDIQEVERNGITFAQITGQLNKVAAAGNDELTITRA